MTAQEKFIHEFGMLAFEDWETGEIATPIGFAVFLVLFIPFFTGKAAA